MSENEKISIREQFKELAIYYKDYEEIKEALRSLHSNGEISDEQYNYCLEMWDIWLSQVKF